MCRKGLEKGEMGKGKRRDGRHKGEWVLGLREGLVEL